MVAVLFFINQARKVYSVALTLLRCVANVRVDGLVNTCIH
jgi:hypothetical protein